MMKRLLLYMSEQPRLQDMATKMEVSRRVASRFVAGDNIQAAAEAVRVLNQKGFTATTDYLGEMVTRKEDAHLAKDEYLQALESIHSNKLDSNVSLKLTQFGLGIDEEFCKQN